MKQNISEIAFKDLINKFPKTTELKKYVYYRISNILKEYYSECDKYERIYEEYMQKPKFECILNETKNIDFNNKIKHEQYKTAYFELEALLSNTAMKEDIWQEEVHRILTLLYPQYIYAVREIKFQGIDKHQKKPDFILVDVNGFVDLLEIKRPYIHLLREHKYRNNFVPSGEFAGAIQQIEKYLFCLNSNIIAKKQVINSLREKGKISADFDITILNPQGMLLLGRSNDLNKQQKDDLELIKRQYKHVVDIMTYDDFLLRLKNIIYALETKI